MSDVKDRKYPRVILFSSSSCPWCSRVKNYLYQKNFVSIQTYYIYLSLRSDSDVAISVLLLGINFTTPGLPRSFGARNDVFH